VHVFKQNWHILAGFWHIGQILSEKLHDFSNHFPPKKPVTTFLSSQKSDIIIVLARQLTIE
jgi:hypothetical protein